MKTTLSTQRLLLRPWRSEDLEPFARMSADPRVMEHFPATLSREESDALAARIAREIDELGYGFWALEERHSNDFVGFVGVRSPTDPLPFSPCVEVGWRLAHEHWSKGFAQEGARAAIEFGFRELAQSEIVAFTTVQNQRSRRVMERLGMRERGEFEHPSLPWDSPLRPHVWYSLARPERKL